MQYSIIIADDHEIVRYGIKFIINSQEKFILEDEASSFEHLMSILSKNMCDILILDLNLGDKNGIQSIREIKKLYSDLPILVLSMFPEDPYALQSIQAGALAYLSKKMLSSELLIALESISKGEIYLSDVYKKTLPDDIELEILPRNPTESLSQREFEVYSLIALGHTYKEISSKLELSPKTISTYRTRILAKLSLRSTGQLIHFALQDSLGKKNILTHY